MEAVSAQEIQRLESEISRLQVDLLKARESVRSWTDANAALSRSAAEARAKNQGSGRGMLGAFLGSKFRSAMRAGAAASNAAIAKEVASKRNEIASQKFRAQDQIKYIQGRMAELRSQLRSAKTAQRSSAARKVASRIHRKSSVDLLHKLKEAHSLGLLTDSEYEEKRRKIASEI